MVYDTVMQRCVCEVRGMLDLYFFNTVTRVGVSEPNILTCRVTGEHAHRR